MAFWNSKKNNDEVLEAVSIPAVRAEGGALVGNTVATRAGASNIALGTIVSGSVQSEGDVVVDGVVVGDVRCATLTIGKAGEVRGNVAAETATIRGKVAGDVRARTIQLAATGSIEGDLTHSVLIIEEGGSFEGRSRRSADPLNEPAIPKKVEASKASASSSTKPAAKATAKQAAKTASKSAPVVPATKVSAEGRIVTPTPAPHLDDAPRSGVADALGERFLENA
jgi:cytoskeletal protein CcmA (bactofilin family)